MADAIYVSRLLPDPGTAALRDAGFEVRQHEGEAAPSADELRAGLDGAVGAITLLTDRIDGAVLDAAPSLRVVANLAVGYDNIDVAAARERGVVVTNTPDVLTDATADLAWALLLNAARRIGEGERLVRAHQWKGWSPTQLLGPSLPGKTLGIFGLGKIGAAVARRARGFDMEIQYTTRRPRPEAESELGATWVDFDTLVQRSDFIVITAPLTDETRHAFDANAFRSMRSDAVLVNAGRGPIIDEYALVEALRDGEIAAAALDVYEREPEIEAGLFDLDQVVLAPHLGSATREARAAMVTLCCDNVLAVLGGKEPLTPVV